MLTINLHNIANKVITSVHPNASALLYRSIGQQNIKGKIVPLYESPEAIEVQVQSEGAASLHHANKVGQEEVSRKLYVKSQAISDKRIAGIVRSLSRGGDFIKITNANDWYANSWWLVEASIEDFTASGWQCVRATMQTLPPDLILDQTEKA